MDPRVARLFVSIMYKFLDMEDEISSAQVLALVMVVQGQWAQQRIQQGVRRPNRPRNRARGHVQLLEDYFGDNLVFGEELFRKRFRMGRSLFLRILEAVVSNCDYFVQKPDALGQLGLSPLQKITSALRMLAYDACGDQLDEYIRIGESTSLVCLEKFCEIICKVFGPRYLRSPTIADVERILKHSAERGWPGMMGSIDCMHWNWKNCPVEWAGQFQSRKGTKSMILEAVATKDLWIWHLYFRTPGSNNDLNVLNSSHLFEDLLNGKSPLARFTCNGRTFDQTYYLADGIYPRWPVFVQTISNPVTEPQKYFAVRQEAARKDIERAFGVLRQRWAILCNPTWLWHRANIHNVIMTCLILHNVVVEDEQEGALDCLNWVGDDVQVTPPGRPPTNWQEQFPAFVATRNALHNNQAHGVLQSNLVEHLWATRNH